MAKLPDLERAAWGYILENPEGVSAREVQDNLETPQRGSDRLTKGEVRKALENLVEADIIAKDKHPQTHAVTYLPVEGVKPPPGE